MALVIAALGAVSEKFRLNDSERPEPTPSWSTHSSVAALHAG